LKFFKCHISYRGLLIVEWFHKLLEVLIIGYFPSTQPKRLVSPLESLIVSISLQGPTEVMVHPLRHSSLNNRSIFLPTLAQAVGRYAT
jgi:hypothetical protein